MGTWQNIHPCLRLLSWNYLFSAFQKDELDFKMLGMKSLASHFWPIFDERLKPLSRNDFPSSLHNVILKYSYKLDTIFIFYHICLMNASLRSKPSSYDDIYKIFHSGHTVQLYGQYHCRISLSEFTLCSLIDAHGVFHLNWVNGALDMRKHRGIGPTT